MVGISIKEVNDGRTVRGNSIVRIPVTIPEGHRPAGSNFCVNISDLSFEYTDEARINTSLCTGYPFVSMKR